MITPSGPRPNFILSTKISEYFFVWFGWEQTCIDFVHIHWRWLTPSEFNSDIIICNTSHTKNVTKEVQTHKILACVCVKVARNSVWNLVFN